MKQLVTADRIRSIISGASTEKEAADALRRHRIRFEFSTEGGTFHIRIPCRSGCVRVTRTACRPYPLRISPATPVPYPYQLPRWTWDD